MALALNQVNYKDSSSWTSLIDMVYPKGSFYLYYNDNTPSSLFGGSWSKTDAGNCLRSGAITKFSQNNGSDKHTHMAGSGYDKTYGLRVNQYMTYNNNTHAVIYGWNRATYPGATTPTALNVKLGDHLSNIYWPTTSAEISWGASESPDSTDQTYGIPQVIGYIRPNLSCSYTDGKDYNVDVAESNEGTPPVKYVTVNTWYRTS